MRIFRTVNAVCFNVTYFLDTVKRFDQHNYYVVSTLYSK
jgi:hypothetical protein